MRRWRQDRVHFAKESEWGDETAYAADEADYDVWEWDAAGDGADDQSYAGDFDAEAAYYGEDPAEETLFDMQEYDVVCAANILLSWLIPQLADPTVDLVCEDDHDEVENFEAYLKDMHAHKRYAQLHVWVKNYLNTAVSNEASENVQVPEQAVMDEDFSLCRELM